MRLLLDECVPRKLKSFFVAAGHDCETAREAGYGGMANGELLAQAELLFDVLITSDRNLRYQQNFKGRVIAILVLAAHSNDILNNLFLTLLRRLSQSRQVRLWKSEIPS